MSGGPANFWGRSSTRLKEVIIIIKKAGLEAVEGNSQALTLGAAAHLSFCTGLLRAAFMLYSFLFFPISCFFRNSVFYSNSTLFRPISLSLESVFHGQTLIHVFP